VSAGGAFDRASVERFREIGVERILIPPLSFDPVALDDALGQFAEDVIRKVD
jgi:hypothetical protein